VDLMFEQRVSFTAVIAGLDPIAYGVLEALRDRGLDVPRDISLIGFGDFHRGERRPALTSVQIPATEVGRQLARMAAEKGVSGGRVPAVTLPCPLVRRQTCRPCIDD
jgi:DNA-binding LacI/PurR family transcriptional regulator